MGTAKINGVEHWFEDSEHRLDVQVTSGNVVVNGKILFHAEGLADITVEAFDLVGHHFTFSNVGMPKNVEEDVGTITPHEMKPKSKAKATADPALSRAKLRTGTGRATKED